MQQLRAMMENWKEIINDVIDSNKERLTHLSQELWMNPEPAFQEYKAHKLLTSFLREEGFSVEEHHVADTGFRARFECQQQQDGKGDGGSKSKALNVCFPCEYDAAPGVGHAAAHNLCTEASVAAALAIKRCIQEKMFSGKVSET